MKAEPLKEKFRRSIHILCDQAFRCIKKIRSGKKCHVSLIVIGDGPSAFCVNIVPLLKRFDNVLYSPQLSCQSTTNSLFLLYLHSYFLFQQSFLHLVRYYYLVPSYEKSVIVHCNYSGSAAVDKSD